jgi:hypothetical protein
MPQICRLCSHINPPDALFCYYDGVALDAARSTPLVAGLQPFAYPFVFPSGRCCRNFDELVLACDNDWNAAKEVLRLGFLTGFFDAIGRPDLLRAAKHAAKHRDPDRGLDQLLNQLPCTARVPPSLVVQPLMINLGQLTASTKPRLPLHLINEGGGLLHGSVTSEVDWLTLGDAPGSPSKLFQFHYDFEVMVQVVAKNLRASAKPIDGRLVVESNGGHALVFVRVEVPSRPFPSGVLAGALTPRDLARLAKAKPREAAALFDKGAVRKWYEANGWTYPIQRRAARGLAGVQQFFEALGLTKPPLVALSPSTVELHGQPGETLQTTLNVHALEKKYVFAQARSTVGWLKVTSTKTIGQRAQIVLRVPQVPRLPGHQLHGFVQVMANGGQRFTVEVHLSVTGEREAQGENEVIPVAGLADVLPEPVAEVIPIEPMRVSDLLDAIPVEPEEQL